MSDTSSLDINSLSSDIDTFESLREETLQDKEFSNQVSKIYGVEMDSDHVSIDKFTNLRIIDSYPISEYTYEKENGEEINLVEIYILQNKRNNEYIYYIDEPKLSSSRAGTDNPDEGVINAELKWYTRIKSEFDAQASTINKESFVNKQINELKNTTDDIDYIIEFVEENEFAWYIFRNRVLESLYDNILDGVIDKIESLPQKEDLMYEKIPLVTKLKIRYYIQREYLDFGKISPMMKDPSIEEISCNGHSIPIKVYHSEYNQHIITNKAYNKSELSDTVNTLANLSGEQLNTAQPIPDGSLPDGSRINIGLSKDSDGIYTEGDIFTIRVFDEVPLTPIDLLYADTNEFTDDEPDPVEWTYNTISLDQMVFIWLAVQYKFSGLVAGGTASGKTTTLNTMSTFTAPSDKIVTMEDTEELVLHSDNYVKGITRESTSTDDSYDIGMMDLVVAALRQRPDYLIVGEVRDKAARPMFQAMLTGHTSYATFHAGNISEIKSRLTGDPINISPQMLTALDFVVQQNQLENDRRAIESIREIISVDDEERLVNDVVTEFNHGEVDEPSRGFSKINWIESYIIEQIRIRNNWSNKELKEEINRRKELLIYMAKNMPRDDDKSIKEQANRSEKITNIIKLYMRNPEITMKLKETDLMLEDDINTMMDLIVGSNEAENLAYTINEQLKHIK